MGLDLDYYYSVVKGFHSYLGGVHEALRGGIDISHPDRRAVVSVEALRSRKLDVWSVRSTTRRRGSCWGSL